MSTATAAPISQSEPARIIPDRRYEHIFFSSMALLMLGTVFLGFAKTYFLAGMLHAPLPSRIIHIHGAAFTLWILLLVTQTSLVAAGKVHVHRQLGLAGFILAATMIVLGVLAATDMLKRNNAPPGADPRFFYIIPLSSMVVFGTLMFMGYRARRDPAKHKRLVYLATVSLLVAALARWPFAFIHQRAPVATFASYVFIVALGVYDLYSTRKVNPITWKAGAFLVAVEQIAPLIGMTSLWQSFAGWVQLHG